MLFPTYFVRCAKIKLGNFPQFQHALLIYSNAYVDFEFGIGNNYQATLTIKL